MFGIEEDEVERDLGSGLAWPAARWRDGAREMTADAVVDLDRRPAREGSVGPDVRVVDEGECENIRKQIEEQKQQLEQTRKKVEVTAKEYEAEIAKIQAEWNEVAKTIPAEPLKIFKRVAETYDGEAVAQVEEQEGRHAAYSCGGCFMGITAESVNLLMTHDDIIRCPNCTRILVLSSAQMQV